MPKKYHLEKRQNLHNSMDSMKLVTLKTKNKHFLFPCICISMHNKYKLSEKDAYWFTLAREMWLGHREKGPKETTILSIVFIFYSDNLLMH